MEPVTPSQCREYLTSFNSRLLPEELRLIIAETAKQDDILPPVTVETGLLLQLLIRLHHSRQVLELGTGVGISGIFMAQALPLGGKITTIEHRERFANQARKHFQRCGVEDRIEIICGDVQEVVSSLEGRFDLIFQDSGKQTYTKVLQGLITLLRPGGLLIVDDTLMPAMDLPERNQRTQRAIDQFNRELFSSTQLRPLQIPIGKGLTIAEKID